MDHRPPMQFLRKKLESSAELPRIAPFAIYALLGAFQAEGSEARYWSYIAKTMLGAWMLWEVRPFVPENYLRAAEKKIAATREAQGLSDVSTDIASIANAIGPQAADIIAASRNPIPGYVPTPGVNPNAYQTATGLTLPGGSTFSLQSLGTVGTLVLLAAAIGFVVFMLRPRR